MAGAQEEGEFEADTTALQPVVFQFHSYKVEVPPAKAWWCPELNITLLRTNGFVSGLLAAAPTVVI